MLSSGFRGSRTIGEELSMNNPFALIGNPAERNTPAVVKWLG
jgi:hypothetical protein